MREVAIVSPVRTAVGNFGGGMRDISAAELGSIVIQEALSRAGLNTVSAMVQFLSVPNKSVVDIGIFRLTFDDRSCGNTSGTWRPPACQISAASLISP